MTERHRGFEVGSENAPHTILWLHGYTGAPDAFAQSASRFAEELDAKVMVPLLPGHGTEESHLRSHTYEDFVSSAHHFMEHALSRGKPFALIGYSFSSSLAVQLAHEHTPAALVLPLAPYRFRFPFWIPGVSSILALMPYVGKHFTEEDIRIRRGIFYYPHLPGKALSLLEEGNRRMREILPSLACPILALHNENDPLVRPESGTVLLAESVGNPDNMARVFPHDRHEFFIGPDRVRDEDVVIEFLRRQFQKENAAMQVMHSGEVV